MVFSALFGKKRDRQEPSEPGSTTPAATAPQTEPSLVEGRPATSVASAATSAPTPEPVASGAVASGLPSARDVARATAEKIDRIESEMALDFPTGNAPAPAVPPVQASTSLQQPTLPPTPPASDSSVSKSPSRKRRPEGTASTVPSLGQSTDILLGDSILANALELSDSASNPAIEEAAILYANGQALPAAAALQDAIRNDAAGHHAAATQAWLMLFELLQVLDKRAEFENLAIDYAVRFETSAPAWLNLAVADTAAPAASTTPADRAVVTFTGVLNGGILPLLDQLKRLAQKNPVLWLEFDKLTAVDAPGADLMLRVFTAFQKSNHEVVLSGCAHLSSLCQKAVEVGRHDTSTSIWMLLLETYRLLNRRAAFEEAGIDYCVTYEVSPPSWEPPSRRFRVEDGHAEASVVVGVEAESLDPDVIALRGDLIGKLESELQRLNNFSSVHEHICVDCSRLRRVDFTAAGALLNWAVSMQVAGSPVRFVEVGHLIAALFVVMGLHEVAQIERKTA